VEKVKVASLDCAWVGAAGLISMNCTRPDHQCRDAQFACTSVKLTARRWDASGQPLLVVPKLQFSGGSLIYDCVEDAIFSPDDKLIVSTAGEVIRG
jgi:hypothetical protein